MQCNDDKDTEGGKDGGEKKPGKAAAANEVTDEGGATTNYDEEEATTTATTLIVPTKTEDGGRNEQGNQSSHNQGQGETAASNRPDLFRTYSDNNVRMMALLGIEPSANPNDGEQQEDWRQLTGFTGIGEERRRRRNNDNDGGDGNTTQRRTRLSAELHNSAFENMWIQQGLLDEPLQGQPPRQQQEEEEEDDGNSNSDRDSEENQQRDGC
mmetsp:Transcript_25114/g.38010  ORF Transcript_25114/g.38010 Transcript_25114/m.38010 type:complete len:211 (+) Transcript_25114:334-966(+)